MEKVSFEPGMKINSECAMDGKSGEQVERAVGRCSAVIVMKETPPKTA